MIIRILYICIIYTILVKNVMAQVSIQTWVDAKIAKGSTFQATSYLDDLLALQARWPWVEKFELRTETDRLQTQRQEFLFRTSFLGFSRRKFEFLKFRQYAEKELCSHREILYEQLIEPYLEAVTLVKKQYNRKFTLQKIAHCQETDSLYLVQLSSGVKIDLEDFLKNREEWIVLEKKQREDSIFIRHQLENAGFIETDSILLESLVTPEVLKERILSLVVDETKHPALVAKQAEKKYLESEYGVEKAKEQKILDFAQLRYSVREDLLLENRFSVGVGLTIPWNGSSRIRYQEIRAKQWEVQFKENNLSTTLQQKLVDKKGQFFILYDTYSMYQSHKKKPSWVMVEENIIKSGRLDPMNRIQLKKYQLSEDEKIASLRMDMLEVYIEALFLSGRLNPSDSVLETK